MREFISFRIEMAMRWEASLVLHENSWLMQAGVVDEGCQSVQSLAKNIATLPSVKLVRSSQVLSHSAGCICEFAFEHQGLGRDSQFAGPDE